jgi:2-polyprenyl-3-methyl-5-hydroxy-6-metoxy-1,4-benzoquinol methylase
MLSGEHINEQFRQEALNEVRTQNALIVLDTLISARGDANLKLLDVGCAYGWFLASARQAGVEAEGIEPEFEIAERAEASGHKVHIGFFPSDLPEEARYDAITFNDVLEHIPHPRKIAAACHARLNMNGLVSVVLPLRTGIFYRLACLIQRFGVNGPFERMWQASFQSPHLSYFSHESIRKMMKEEGFEQVYFGRLRTLSFQSLWKRIRYDRSSSRIVAFAQWPAIACLVPLLRILPADIGHFVFRKIEEKQQGE